MKDSMIIIGAGIAGMATGCYAQMNGYRTQIFELHHQPGGLCTSWQRKGYTFDGCIHHLAGAGPSSALHRTWAELGAVQGREMVYDEAFVRVEGPDGKAFTVYTDPERLEQHMRELAPADSAAIEAYARAVRRFTGFELLALPAKKPWEMVAILPFLPALVKWGKVTLEQYATRFSDPFLQQAFPCIQYGFAGIPAVVNLGFLAGCHNHHLGWPMGGSLPFSRAIERRYRDLGGEVHYRSRVERVLVEACPEASGKNDRAVGIRLADGSEHRADVVISAADGHATIFDMLGGKYTDEKIRDYYAAAPGSQVMNVHVSLGIARDLTREPRAIALLLEQPITLMGKPFERLDVEIYGSHLGMAPPGKTALKVLLEGSYAYWKELRGDRARYDEEKQRVAETVIGQLENRFPGLRAQVEVVDVATPVTVERFTGNWQGLQAWSIPGAGLMDTMKGLSQTLPGLKRFYMVGQWAQAAIGLSTAALAGRKLVETLCRRDGRPFATTVAPE